MQELIELALKKIDALEKKVEKYFSMLKIENELDFILKGTYVLDSDIQCLLNGENKEEQWALLKI